MKNWLEKQFRLSEFNTNIKTELLAGLTTFVTMAPIAPTWHLCRTVEKETAPCICQRL